MTLQEIAAELQTLIHRLQNARSILATLQPIESTLAKAAVHRAKPASRKVAAIVPEPAVEETVPVPPPIRPRRVPPQHRREGGARGPRLRAHPVPHALSALVPSGPVVIAPAKVAQAREEAAREGTQRQPSPSPLPGNSLDDLVRELNQRPGGLALR